MICIAALSAWFPIIFRSSLLCAFEFYMYRLLIMSEYYFGIKYLICTMYGMCACRIPGDLDNVLFMFDLILRGETEVNKGCALLFYRL